MTTFTFEVIPKRVIIDTSIEAALKRIILEYILCIQYLP